METGQVLGTTLTQCTVLEGDKEPPDIRPFELYLVLQVGLSIGTEFYNPLNHSQFPGIHITEAKFILHATTTRKTVSTSKLSRMV